MTNNRERSSERKRANAPAPVTAAKDQRKQSADTRAKRAPLKKTLEALEKDIARLNKQRGDLEARLADPGSYSDPAINVAELQRDKGRLEREIPPAEHEGPGGQGGH